MPERSCVSCRKKGTKEELLRLVVGPSGVVIDYSGRLPGRGAYLCPEKSCIEKGLKEAALSRAFKKRTTPPGLNDFYGELEGKVQRKINSLLGMARKSGIAAAGFDAASGAMEHYPGGVIVTAEDIAPNTEGKFMETADGKYAGFFRYSDKEGLGRLLGADPVGVVYIKSSALSIALNREMGRLIDIRRG